MPEFRTRDPLSPAFWDERFDKTFTPWDRGAAPERLRRFVTETANQVAATAWQPPALAPRVLIPGCGAGYELALLSEAGWDATAIDFSPSAVAAARQNVGTWAERVVEADFFAYAPPKPLDVIYERAFLCAMPRHMWPQVIQRWAALLPEGARLVGYFYFDNNEKGPPFGANREELVARLERDFVLEQDEPVEDSIPVFQGKERWMSWRRKKGL